MVQSALCGGKDSVTYCPVHQVMLLKKKKKMVGYMRMSKLCQSDTKLSYLVGGLNSKQTLQIAQFYPKGNSIILSIMWPTLEVFLSPIQLEHFPNITLLCQININVLSFPNHFYSPATTFTVNKYLIKTFTWE